MKKLIFIALVGATFGTLLALSTPASARLQSARPWMGVGIEQGKTGVIVNRVIRDTPAEKAGFKAGDEILKIDDTIVKNPKQMIELVASKGVGNTVKVDFLRGGKPEKVELKLMQRPDVLDLAKKQLMGKKAPDFELERLGTGKKISLSQFAGKPVLIKFWATWCPACKSVLPDVVKFSKQAGKDYAVLTVATQEKSELTEAFRGSSMPDVPILIDGDGVTGSAYFIPALPTFVVVDKAGVIRHVAVGAGVYFDQAKDAIEKLTKP